MATSKRTIEQAMVDNYNANLSKNAAATAERKSLKEAETLYAASKKNSKVTFVVNDGLYLEAGYVTDETEEIDAKKLFETDPVSFWKLVSVPITNARGMLGDKKVAQLSRPVKKTTFKISKVKGTIPNED